MSERVETKHETTETENFLTFPVLPRRLCVSVRRHVRLDRIRTRSRKVPILDAARGRGGNLPRMGHVPLGVSCGSAVCSTMENQTNRPKGACDSKRVKYGCLTMMMTDYTCPTHQTLPHTNT